MAVRMCKPISKGDVKGPVLSGNFSGPVTIETNGSRGPHDRPPLVRTVMSQQTAHSSYAYRPHTAPVRMSN